MNEKSKPTEPNDVLDSELSLRGKALVAMPNMDDPRFDRSLIYIMEHDDKGASGIVINKPFDAIIFEDLLEQLQITPLIDLSQQRILMGGPVDIGRGFIVHTCDVLLGHSERIDNNIAITTSMDMLRRIADNSGPEKSMFILGYSGWTESQLEEELKENMWLVCDGTPELLFDTPLELRWEKAMKMLGIDLEKLTSDYGHV